MESVKRIIQGREQVVDRRYRHVHSIWQAGDLKSFKRMFEIIPRSVVSDDLGMHYNSFTNKLNRPELLNLKQLFLLVEFIGINIGALVELVAADIEA